MLKSYSVARSSRYCGWKSSSVLCTLMILASCNGGGSSGGGGVDRTPSAPTSLSLFEPNTSSGLDSTPTISVGGVVSGDTVKLFSDSSCTNELGSATASSTSVNITVSSSLSTAVHTFYANLTNGNGTSPCSSASISYTSGCPAEFILVPHNSSVLTTSDFCVMKYEAKNNGGVAVSQAAGNPYVDLTIGASQTKCTDLNALNGVSDKFDLISNPEWMTIARNAESVSSNFEADVMARGWTMTASGVAPSTGPNCIYKTGDSTCASSGEHLYKRTLNLTNGEEIWDLSGNVWEWVDWNPATPGLQLGPTTCSASWVEFTALPSDPCFIGGSLSANQVLPATPSGSSIQAFGQFYGGTGGTVGAARRGGSFGSGSDAGVFGLNLSGSSTSTNWHIGFRCVYRP